MLLNYEKIYSWVSDKNYSESVFHIFEVIDDLMGQGQFQEASKQLLDLDFANLDTYALVAVLAVSSWGNAKLDLPNRDLIVNAAKKQIMKLDPSRYDSLVKNF